MDLKAFCQLEDELKAGRQPDLKPLKAGVPDPPKVNWQE
jgi:hypothetical protein